MPLQTKSFVDLDVICRAWSRRYVFLRFNGQERRALIITRPHNTEVIRNYEVPFHNPNGGLIWLSLAVVLTRLDQQDALMYAFKDITPLKIREAQLLNRANTDNLAGLCSYRVQIACTASFGVVSNQITPGVIIMDLFDERINKADLVKYQAKHNGRNRIESY